MIVDSSAIAAILFDEPDAPVLRMRIAETERRLISAASVLELVIVLAARYPGAGAQPVTRLLVALGLQTEGISTVQLTTAIEAFLRFGKGRHPARLNFGDCFSYALAKSLDEPLLFKGEDFSKTDVKVG